jgi:hypothetical protein
MCAGGGARRRRGVRPNQGTIGQSNGSVSFTRDQGRCVCKESENDSPDCSVYARRRATEVRWGRSWVSGEVMSGPSAWKASRATSKANRGAGAAWTRLERAGRGGWGLGSGGGRRKRSPELKRGVWLARVSTAEGEGARRTWPYAGSSARTSWANAGVPTRVKHVCAFILPEFWRVWSFIRACSRLGQCTKPLLLSISYRSCVGVIGFCLLVSKIWSSEVWFVS